MVAEEPKLSKRIAADGSGGWSNVPPVVRVESSEDGCCLHVTISDNGRGFDPVAAEGIFSPFERLQRDVEGSGIGLAIVRSIAERPVGSGTAHSTPREGGVFRVSLPADARRYCRALTRG